MNELFNESHNDEIFLDWTVAEIEHGPVEAVVHQFFW